MEQPNKPVTLNYAAPGAGLAVPGAGLFLALINATACLASLCLVPLVGDALIGNLRVGQSFPAALIFGLPAAAVMSILFFAWSIWSGASSTAHHIWLRRLVVAPLFVAATVLAALVTLIVVTSFRS